MKISGSQRAKEMAEDYIKGCWPNGCPAHQKIETKLAFYAGGIFSFLEIVNIEKTYKDDEKTRDHVLGELIEAMIDNTVRLNKERGQKI